MNKSTRNIRIEETEEHLREIFLKEKDGRQRERLQFLYLLKSKKIKSVQQATKILGRHRNTISEWIKKYQEGGLLCLTDRTSPPGRESQIRGEVFEKLKEKLSDPIGFGFYKDIQKWLKEEFNLDIHYQSIFKICHSPYALTLI